MAVRSRPRQWSDADDEEAFFDDDPFEPPLGHAHRRMRRGRELPPELLRFGVQFSDGRKATNVGGSFPWDYGPDADEEPPGPILSQRGGGGGNGNWEWEFWLWPMPPAGPLAFVVEWPAEQIELTRHEVDAALFLNAAAESEALWPESRSTGQGVSFQVSGQLRPSEDGSTEEEQEPDTQKEV